MKYRNFAPLIFAAGCALLNISVCSATVRADIAEKVGSRPAIRRDSGDSHKIKLRLKGTEAVVPDRGAPLGKKAAVKAKQDSITIKTAEKAKPKKSSLFEEKNGRAYFAGTELPEGYKKISIFGEAEAGKAQAVALIKANNPDVRLECSVEELVDLYWEEAGQENIRPDLALSQALVETGFFRYGGDVHHKQNNFCGLGTTGGGVKGANFDTPRVGVRAHVQHLLAYTQKRRPSTKIVDPRYEMAHRLRMERGMVDTWYGLNGTWAMGSLYCEKIMANYQRMLAMEAADKDRGKDKKDKKQRRDKKETMRERIDRLLKERR